MRGPLSKGSLAKYTVPSAWEISRNFGRGAIYRVTEEFTDMDGDKHLPGESWRFIASAESWKDDLFVIGVEIDKKEYEIYFDTSIPTQVELVDSLHFKVEPVSW